MITRVGELIAALQQFPADFVVGVPADSENGPILDTPYVVRVDDPDYSPVDVAIGNDMALDEMGLEVPES